MPLPLLNAKNNKNELFKGKSSCIKEWIIARFEEIAYESFQNHFRVEVQQHKQTEGLPVTKLIIHVRFHIGAKFPA